ncbi:MAG: hypothetical protein IPM16_04660 [Chloroflexi bacterium]|nr:hypothetical protein [Chloroflexota bacterium]
MSDSVQIRKVETKADHKVFLEFPWRIYRADPNWVPPLLSMRRDVVSKEKNAAWEYMEGDYFIAWRGDEPVGTIAAFINRRHNEHWGTNVGFFGAFEAIDDESVAHALLQTACDWVKAKGFPSIIGPQTFTTHEEVGLLIDGFEQPLLLMSYHHPYYQRLIESFGFVKSMDMNSFYYDWDMVADEGTEERLGKIVEWRMKKGNITVRPSDPRQRRADFEIIKQLYNDAWDSNWGFVPLTPRELDAMVESLGLVFNPDWTYFAFIEGKPVGLIMSVGDFNQVLKHVRPRPGIPEPISLIGALWHWKIRPKITRVRVPLLGVVPEHRNKGVDLVLVYHLMKALRNTGIQAADCGWILETNQDMAGTLRGLGMPTYRTYRIYQREL